MSFQTFADSTYSDEIYLHCVEDCKPRAATGELQKTHDFEDPFGCHQIQVFCQRGASKPLMLVSRQFSFEYLDIIKKQAEIYFYDEYYGDESDDDWSPPLSDALFTHVSTAKLCLLECSAASGAGDLNFHCKWVSRMQHQFSMLSKVDITLRVVTDCKPVYYPEEPDTEDSGFLEKVTTLIDLTGASSLEVIMGESDHEQGWSVLSQDDKFQKTSTCYGKWSKQGGWVVEGAKQG